MEQTVISCWELVDTTGLSLASDRLLLETS